MYNFHLSILASIAIVNLGDNLVDFSEKQSIENRPAYEHHNRRAHLRIRGRVTIPKKHECGLVNA